MKVIQDTVKRLIALVMVLTVAYGSASAFDGGSTKPIDTEGWISGKLGITHEDNFETGEAKPIFYLDTGKKLLFLQNDFDRQFPNLENGDQIQIKGSESKGHLMADAAKRKSLAKKSNVRISGLGLKTAFVLLHPVAGPQSSVTATQIRNWAFDQEPSLDDYFREASYDKYLSRESTTPPEMFLARTTFQLPPMSCALTCLRYLKKPESPCLSKLVTHIRNTIWSGTSCRPSVLGAD